MKALLYKNREARTNSKWVHCTREYGDSRYYNYLLSPRYSGL